MKKVCLAVEIKDISQKAINIFSKILQKIPCKRTSERERERDREI